MFAYCNNNSTNNYDPSGNVCVCEVDSIVCTGSFIANANDRTAVSSTVVNGAEPRDITEELNKLMDEHAAELANCYSNSYRIIKLLLMGMRSMGIPSYSKMYAESIAAGYFAYREQTGGNWDLKNNDYPYKEDFIYDGKIYSGEDIGNIHYGYVGSAVFSPTVLHTGAGIYQIFFSNSQWSYWSTLFDEPRDYEMVEIGIKLYNERK